MRIAISSVILGLALSLGALSVAAAQSAAPPRLGQLHDALRLTPAQEDAWRAYEAALRPTPGGAARHQQTEAMMPRLTTPRRIALLDATMQQDLADLRRQGQAVIAFYNALTPGQQAVFDRQTLQKDDDRGQ
ncbi:Spy/CpxP family protein refolding chaperone [Caulobacter sp. KR2-114]|uniref:Spy/CpxP family protein refolding chaperone n=1 Tax=Caulobacter sp. KR2-114 TaxID=3400912 RepID=UPI003C01F623